VFKETLWDVSGDQSVNLSSLKEISKISAFRSLLYDDIGRMRFGNEIDWL
jgi:hypothetical protein